MIDEMLETPEETTEATATTQDKTEKTKDKSKDPDPYCCTPPDNDPGPIGG